LVEIKETPVLVNTFIHLLSCSTQRWSLQLGTDLPSFIPRSGLTGVGYLRNFLSYPLLNVENQFNLVEMSMFYSADEIWTQSQT